MHWENLPKVTHNEDAIREYERLESRQIAKGLKRAVFFILPLALLIVGLLRHQKKTAENGSAAFVMRSGAQQEERRMGEFPIGQNLIDDLLSCHHNG